jgi:hypothetical protein
VRVRREAEELAYALKTRVGAKNAFGGNEPMRLSVAHNLQPALSKARAEAEKLRGEKALLLRHNRHLLLEIDRLQSAAALKGPAHQPPPPPQPAAPPSASSQLVATDSPDAPHPFIPHGPEARWPYADVNAHPSVPDGPEASTEVPDVVSWPPTGADVVAMRRQYDELKTEYLSQRKELVAAHKLNRELLDKAKTVEEQSKAVNALRDELLPLIAATKREAAEDRIWDDPDKLTATAHLAIRAGISEHRVSHMITRAKQLEANSAVRRSPRPHSAYADSTPRGTPNAQVWSVGRDDAHRDLHDGTAFVTGTARNLREPHKGGSGQFANARGSPSQRGMLGGGSPGSPRRGTLGSRDQRGGSKGTRIDFYETRGTMSPIAFGEGSGTFYPEVYPDAGEGDGDAPNSAARLRSEVAGARTFVAVSLDFSGAGDVVCRLVPTGGE